MFSDYREIACALWQLLDDIDTADDWAKSNDTAYRQAVRKKAHDRFKYIVSDGYSLYLHDGTLIEEIGPGEKKGGGEILAKHEAMKR